MLDLFVAWLTGPDLQIAVDLNATRFGPGTRYAKLHLSYRPFAAAYNGLLGLRLIQVDKKGFFDAATRQGKNTKIRATEKLIHLLTGQADLALLDIRRHPEAPPIILKDSEGNDISFEETNETRAMEANLRLINGVLEANWFDIYIPDVEMEDLTKSLYENTNKKVGSAPTSPSARAQTIQ